MVLTSVKTFRESGFTTRRGRGPPIVEMDPGPRHPFRSEKPMTSIDLTGRTALVTGGAQGLGEGMAQALAGAGAKVMIADL